MNVNNHAGLTLLEVLIAVTILAFMSLAVIETTNNSADSKDSIIAEDRELLQVETALDRLNWDFSQIYTPLYHTQKFKIDKRAENETREKQRILLENPIYGRGGRFSGPDFFGRPIPIISQDGKEAIEFYTKGHRRRFQDSKESEFAWVRYEFRSYKGEDESKQGLLELVRYYRPTNIHSSDGDLQELPATILSNRIVEYTWFFWDEKNGKWEESLSRTSNPPNFLRGLKLEIKWQRGSDKREEFISRVYRTIWPRFKPENLNKIKYQGTTSFKKSPVKRVGDG